MLIAPLMSSILAFALALVTGDPARAGRALATLLVGLVLAVALSAALGRLVSAGEFNFLEQLPTEILGRTRPTLFDLAVALAGGAAAAYALSQPQLSATLPGGRDRHRSDAASLCGGLSGSPRSEWMWPEGLCCCSSPTSWRSSSPASLVFSGVGFRPASLRHRGNGLTRGLFLSVGLLLLVVVPLVLFTVRIARDAQENEAIRTTLVEQLAMVGDSSLVSFESRPGPDGHLDIVVTVRAPRSLTYAEANEVQRVVATRLQLPIAMKFFIVPVTKLDPLVPPTFTPTPLPGATATPDVHSDSCLYGYPSANLAADNRHLIRPRPLYPAQHPLPQPRRRRPPTPSPDRDPAGLRGGWRHRPGRGQLPSNPRAHRGGSGHP